MTGRIFSHPSPVAPAGSIPANGGTVSAADYPNLAATPGMIVEDGNILLPDATPDKPTDGTGRYTLFAYIEI